MPWRPLVTYEMMAQFKIETKLVFKKPLFFFNQADYGNDRSKYLRVQPSTALAILEKLKEAEKKNLVRTIFFDLFPRFFGRSQFNGKIFGRQRMFKRDKNGALILRFESDDPTD
jgi:hypothetical protein